jgi:hypothetical protein
MQRHHTGSGRRRVVPADWGRNHAPVAAGTRNATGTLRHAAEGGDQADWDPVDRVTVPLDGAAYAADVTARIQSLVTHRSDAQVEVAEDLVITASYLVTVDLDLEATEGDTFTVATCTDTTLVDQIFRVEHVVRGTERFERDLFCNLLEPPPATD